MPEQTVTLTPKNHDRLGPIRCDVPQEGFVAVGGYTRAIDDGKELVFERSGIKVQRNGNEYTFTKLT